MSLLTPGSSSYSQRCIGYWCPYRYASECEDCPRIGRSNPWCPCLHVNFNMCLLDVYSNPLTLRFFIFSDKARRSVPAPGRGALTVAREIQSKYPLPILDVAYCSRQIAFRRNQIPEWLHKQNQQQEEIEYRNAQGEGLLPGKWLACYRVSLLISCLETATASMSMNVMVLC
jgi:hypothetical protein